MYNIPQFYKLVLSTQIKDHIIEQIGEFIVTYKSTDLWLAFLRNLQE